MNIIKRVLSVLMILVMLVPMGVSVAADYERSATDCNYFRVISKNKYEIASGITESEYVLNNFTYSDRNKLHVVEADLGDPDVSVIPGYYNISETADYSFKQYMDTQTVSEHISYAESRLGANVVAAMNVSLAWNCSAPYGLLVYNGVKLYDGRSYCGGCGSSHAGKGYLAIMNDGTAELREPFAALTGNELHAMTLPFNWLVKDGINQYAEDHDSFGTARSVIGIKADGKLVIVTNEGNVSGSYGMTNHEIADTMLSLGCVDAVNCDGGGSSIMYTQRKSYTGIAMRGIPSDGTPRETSTSILITTGGTGTPLETVATGSCGLMAKWTLDSHGKLVISGRGDMTDYSSTSAPPWNDYFSQYPVTKVIIEEGITSVGDYAFIGFNAIKSVSLPSTLKEIGYRTFMGCTSLTNVHIPDSVKRMGKSAFANCSSLRTITLPEEMDYIGSSGFYGCSSLESIILPYGIDEIAYQLFVNCTSLSRVSVRTRGTGWLTKGASVIGQWAFSGCTALKEFTVPDSVHTIKYQAFEYCNGLALTLPKRVMTIEDDLFYNSSNCRIKCAQYSGAEEYAMLNAIPYEYTEESRVEDMLGEVDLGPYDIEGAAVDFGGTRVNLIDLEASVELGKSELKFVSNSDGTVRILLGFDQSDEANIKGANASDTYWSDSYKQVKSMYQNVTGNKVSTTRLWNGFSSLRGKLKKNNANMVVKVDSYAAGYLEFKTVDGELVFSEGGLMVEFSSGVNVKSQGPVYVVLGVGVDADGKIYFKNDNGVIRPDMLLNAQLSLTGGVGCDAAVGHLYGDVTGTLYCTVDSTSSTPFILKAGVVATFHGDAFGRSYMDDVIDFGTLQLYPKTAKSTAMAFSREMSDIAEYNAQINSAEPLDRSYLAANSEVAESNAYFRKDNAYPYTSPVLASFDNGGMLMVWIDDTGEKSADNVGTAMYSYYNGSYWSDPSVMYEDGCNNDSPTLYSDGTKAYIVWQKANKTFDEGIETSEMLKAVDLYLCVFDPSDMTFTEPVCITSEDEEIFEFSPHVVKTEDGIRLYWLENSDNNLFMMSGVNSVKYADIDGTYAVTGTGVIVESEDIITDIATTSEGVYYTVYKDSAVTLYDGESIELVSDIDRIESAGEVLYYTKDGCLFAYIDGVSYDYGISVDDMTVVSNGEYTYLFTSVLNEDGTKTLYYCQLDTTYHDASALERYSSEAGYIGSYSPAILGDSELHVAYSYITKDGEGNYLNSSVLVDVGSDEIDTELSYVVFDNTDLGDGELELTVGCDNHSAVNLEDVNITVKDQNGAVLTEDSVAVSIGAYDFAEFDYTLIYEGDVTEISVEVTPVGYTDYDISNNTVNTALECLHIYGDWEYTSEPTYLADGEEARICSGCGDIAETRTAAKLIPEVAVDNYDIRVTGAAYIKDMRYALGEYTTPSEIKAAEGNVALDGSVIAENTVDGKFVYNMPKGGYYTLWIRMTDGTSYIMPLDVTNFTPYVSAYGVKMTVHNLYDVKDLFIAKGEFSSYSEIKQNGYIFSATASKIADKHDYSYTVYEPGVHTVLIRYNDGTSAVFHETLVVDEPVFTTNGLQVTVSNLPDVKVIRTAYGEWSTVKELKATDTIRNFSSKTAIKGKDPYTIQYREEGTVTVIVEYNNGYVKVFHYDVQQKEPTVEQNGNTVTFGDLEGLNVIRYAKGEYTTASEIKRAGGAKALKADAIVDGNIAVTLEAGTYTFCVQYDDESYNYYTVTV